MTESTGRTFEDFANSGTMGSMKPGSGRDPITVSTAILSGMGVSRTSGVSIRSTSINSPIRARNPLASA